MTDAASQLCCEVTPIHKKPFAQPSSRPPHCMTFTGTSRYGQASASVHVYVPLHAMLNISISPPFSKEESVQLSAQYLHAGRLQRSWQPTDFIRCSPSLLSPSEPQKNVHDGVVFDAQRRARGTGTPDQCYERVEQFEKWVSTRVLRTAWCFLQLHNSRMKIYNGQ
jgi:hypothetical protein